MILIRRRKPLGQRVQEARNYLHTGGLHENPDDVTFLLLTEVQSLNARLAYVLGALSIIVSLFLAHVLAGL